MDDLARLVDACSRALLHDGSVADISRRAVRCWNAIAGAATMPADTADWELGEESQSVLQLSFGSESPFVTPDQIAHYATRVYESYWLGEAIRGGISLLAS